MEFETPTTVIVGRSGSKLVVNVVDRGVAEVADLGDLAGKIAELGVDGIELHGHVAVTAFAPTIVKAAAIDGDAYAVGGHHLGITALPRLRITYKGIKMREFGRWVPVWDSVIVLGELSGVVPIIGFSRAGTLLHMSVGRCSVDRVLRLSELLGFVKRFGDVVATCTCRIGSMPFEIYVRRGNRYMLVKLYMNEEYSQSARVLVLLSEAGAVLEREIVEFGGDVMGVVERLGAKL